MIKEGRKLPPLVTDRIPVIIEEISRDSEVVALFSFGSLAKDALKPLSDLDFAVLVSKRIDPETRFKKHLRLIGLFNQVFKTDELDFRFFKDEFDRAFLEGVGYYR
jgi:predicted nucleotidyltransferase